MANNNPKYKPLLNNKLFLKYIPHGIDHTLFKPLSINEQGNTLEIKKDNTTYSITEFEEMLEFKNKILNGRFYDFIILFNSRNIRRKSVGDILLSFHQFNMMLSEDQRKGTLMIMHTHIVDENGTDLGAVKSALCDDDNIIFSVDKLETKHMNYLYNIADVTINISSNEGFGLSTAESLMSGTPIIVNVTGGLQDQCGFVDENNKYLSEKEHYNEEWGSNHDQKYKKCGKWVKPVFPNNRSLAGSPPTPYIFDDRVDWQEVAIKIKEFYDIGHDERKECGKSGRKYLIENNMTANKMGELFINYIDYTLNNFTPKKRFTIINSNKQFNYENYTGISRKD